MIQSLKLRNFRNFKNNEFFFDKKNKKTFILGENGKGKTNILEAISLLTSNNITNIDNRNLVSKNEDIFFIEYEKENGNKIGISFDKKTGRKTYKLNQKNTTNKKIKQENLKSVIFSPIIMNMMYLSPSLRRNFLDNILSNSYEQYSKILKEYKKILNSRNKVLKNISKNKSTKDELNFWDEKFIEKAEIIYEYRFKIIEFLSIHIKKASSYFNGKINKINIEYETKINKENIKKDIKDYLNKNIDRDIILKTTSIGPHIDDFNIFVDDIKLIDFASRGETKSIIIWLKLLETAFIEKITKQKPIILIDDLLSELDEKHKDMIIEKINYYQTFITSINMSDIERKNNSINIIGL